MANSDRAAITARESLAQAQQLTAEREKRAKESAVSLEEVQAARDQAKDPRGAAGGGAMDGCSRSVLRKCVLRRAVSPDRN